MKQTTTLEVSLLGSSSTGFVGLVENQMGLLKGDAWPILWYLESRLLAELT